MSFEWPVLALEDCLDALIDYRGKTPTKTESGVPLVTAKVIKGGRIETPTEFIAHEEFDAWMRRGIPKPGDVVMTTEAPLGEVAQLGQEKVALAQRVITLRGKEGFLDNDYLLYLMLSEAIQEQLKARSTGTTVLGIKQSELRKISVKVPPLDIQRSAASTLKALDDRIALLRETNATLEAMAQALFKSWFVDFDPVHANAGTRAATLPAELQALFPSTFTDTPQGLVPEGWELGQLEDFLVLQRGFDLPSAERIDGNFPIIAASGPSGMHHVAMVKGPGVVTGRSGVLGKVFITLEDYWPLNTTLWVKQFRRATPCFAFELLRRLDFSSFNAGSAVPTLNRNHIHGLPYVLPPENIVQRFEEVAMDLQKRQAANNRQAQTLANLRDTLLPRLISGQLRLPDEAATLAEMGV